MRTRRLVVVALVAAPLRHPGGLHPVSGKSFCLLFGATWRPLRWNQLAVKCQQAVISSTWLKTDNIAAHPERETSFFKRCVSITIPLLSSSRMCSSSRSLPALFSSGAASSVHVDTAMRHCRLRASIAQLQNRFFPLLHPQSATKHSIRFLWPKCQERCGFSKLSHR